MEVNINGFNEQVATFVCDDTVEAGATVKLDGNLTVTACASGDVFCGICLNKREGYAAVQLGGYAVVKTGSDIGTGYKKLAAASDGKVAVNTNGREILVVNSSAEAAGIIL